MKPELIVILTHQDRTVLDAAGLFEDSKDLPVSHWGFKDVGLPPKDMSSLVRAMREADKTTYLEVVSLSEEEGLAGAKLAVEAGFDILMGTCYFDSINDYLRNKPIAYYPFAGRVRGHPSVLEGTIEEIADHASALTPGPARQRWGTFSSPVAPEFGTQGAGDSLVRSVRPAIRLLRYSANHRPPRRTRRSVRPAPEAESQIEPWFAQRDPHACTRPNGSGA